MTSIGYYNKNSQAFQDRTLNVDINDLYNRFLPHIPKGGKILDAGCGGGRDSKYFLSKGYEVVAFDGSAEMVKLASELTGNSIIHMLFKDIDFTNAFEGVWANASLLHVPYEELRDVLKSFHKALHPSGTLFASFKYGATTRETEDRTFFDMNEETIQPYLKGLFAPLEVWKTLDTRSTVAPSPDRSWLNILAKRID